MIISSYVHNCIKISTQKSIKNVYMKHTIYKLILNHLFQSTNFKLDTNDYFELNLFKNWNYKE